MDNAYNCSAVHKNCIGRSAALANTVKADRLVRQDMQTIVGGGQVGGISSHWLPPVCTQYAALVDVLELEKRQSLIESLTRKWSLSEVRGRGSIEQYEVRDWGAISLSLRLTNPETQQRRALPHLLSLEAAERDARRSIEHHETTCTALLTTKDASFVS